MTTKPLMERLADELSWWINWAKDAESVPRRSFQEARRTGTALIGEVDPRRIGLPLPRQKTPDAFDTCRCGHVYDVHGTDDGTPEACRFPLCPCPDFVLHTFPCGR